MEDIKAAVLCIIAAGFIGSLAMVLTPGKKNNGVLRAIVGIFIAVSLFEPLTGLASGIAAIASESPETEEVISSAGNKINGELINALNDEIYSVVTAQSEKFGIEIIEINADVSYNEECIIIQNIQIKLNSDNGRPIEDFRKSVEEITDIPTIIETD